LVFLNLVRKYETSVAEDLDLIQPFLVEEAASLHHSVEERLGMVVEAAELHDRTQDIEEELLMDVQLGAVDPSQEMVEWHNDAVGILHLVPAEGRGVGKRYRHDSNQPLLVDRGQAIDARAVEPTEVDDHLIGIVIILNGIA